jgi:hypothetical protein
VVERGTPPGRRLAQSWGERRSLREAGHVDGDLQAADTRVVAHRRRHLKALHQKLEAHGELWHPHVRRRVIKSHDRQRRTER